MFNDFRCVDYGMNPNFDMSYQEQNMKFAGTNEVENNMNTVNNNMQGIVCPPVYECPIEKCVHRNIVHEVPHVCPINTRIINHHIYRHTYSPCYTCCEENEVCNIQEGNCNCFM